MIEVERKFILKEGDRGRLIDGAEFIGEKVNADTYYDSADFKLTMADIWLRKRNDRFELKMPTNPEESRLSPNRHYHEYETEAEIAEQLGLSNDQSVHGFETLLKESGFEPFGTVTTTRDKFKKDGFALDFDSADFGYEMMEIETMVSDKDEIPGAMDKIKAFAESHGVPFKNTRGKILEYIRRFRPDHYKAMFPEGDGL